MAKTAFWNEKGLFPLISTLFYLSNKETLAYYREGIFITEIQDFDIDYFSKRLTWLNSDGWIWTLKTKRLLSALATIPADLENSEISSIEPLDVARALVATYDKIEPWADPDK